MNKKLCILSFIVAVLLLATTLSACSAYNGANNSEEGKGIRVTLDYGDKNINKTLKLSSNDGLDDYTNVIVNDKAVIGWVDENGNDVEVSNLSDNATIYPKWGVCVRFFNENYEEIAKRVGVQGASYPIPAYQAKKGYKFESWLEMGTNEPLTLAVFPEKNKDFFASYTYQVYTIDYDLQGGVASAELQTEYTVQSSFELPTVKKQGLLFCGWFDEYNQKITEIKSDTTGNMYLTAKFTDTTFSTIVREGSSTVTDSGIANQQVDFVDISNFIDLDTCKKYGYTKLQITVSMDVKEEFDGYQHCFLYSDSYVGVDKSNSSLKGLFYKYMLGEQEQVSDPYFLAGYRFEHGAGENNGNWARYNITFTVDLSDLISSKKLFIRYSASGIWEDTWINRNIAVSVNAIR